MINLATLFSLSITAGRQVQEEFHQALLSAIYVATSLCKHLYLSQDIFACNAIWALSHPKQ